MAFCAGYGIKCYLIAQDISQLHSAYGKDESITSQCHVQIAFPPNRVETAEHISRMAGKTTYEISQQSYGAGVFMHASRSLQQVGRDLMTPDEALRMSGPKKDERGNILEPGDMILFVAGFHPVYGKQPLYFQDDTLLARAKVSPVKTDILR
jgi:type IV secretion system protein VirD4